MRHTQFPIPVDTHDGLTVEAGHRSASQPWNGQPVGSIGLSGRRIERLASLSPTIPQASHRPP